MVVVYNMYLSGLNISGSSQCSGLWWMAYVGIMTVKSFVKCTPFKAQSFIASSEGAVVGTVEVEQHKSDFFAPA